MEKGNGCRLSPVDLRDYKIKAGGLQLPDEFELKFTHNVKDQGAVNSCVGHATSEILEYYGKTNMSTNFIYSVRNKLFGDTGMGMTLVDACKTVQKYGDMTNSDCPGNIEAPMCFSQADKFFAESDKLNTAYKYRIDSYYLCATPNDIKAAIMNYGPVLGAIKWYDEFQCDKSTDYKLYFNDTTNYGYHAIMIYGWNKDGFLFQNSWGKSFGNKGCATLPYEYDIAEARCLIDHDNSLDTENIEIIKPSVAKNGLKYKLYKILNKAINFIRK